MNAKYDTHASLISNNRRVTYNPAAKYYTFTGSSIMPSNEELCQT